MGNVYTKQQAIDVIVDDMDEWSEDNIKAYAKEVLREKLEETPIEELEIELNMCLCTLDTDDDDDYNKIIDTKASKLLLDK